MCGIAGVWGAADAERVQRMIQLQSHRGPDGRATHVQPDRVALGHTRLAIMDPAGGDQPISSPDGSARIIANGEIYNHESFRDELGSKVDFSTTSDSETALQVLQLEGDDGVQQLDGMFALAVLDRRGLLLARDPIGIKPLYYGTQETGDREQLYFASEIKALAPWVREVHEFPPGHVYRPKSGFQSFYEVPHKDSTDADVNALTDRLRSNLDSAVRKRLMSDVPLGAFLSGGLDSSIIAALAMRHRGELHTFSVGMEGSPDLRSARIVADHIGSIHHELIYTADDVRKALPEIVLRLESFDRDLVRSAIPTWFCARLASQYVKVILTGEGADELFAGYTYYKSYSDPTRLQRELHRSVGSLHNMNLQRVDRMTMAHGVEGRVPFLDTDFIDLAAGVPPEHKLRASNGGQPVEKWILRRSFQHLLPDEVVWRDKEQFDEGSGTLEMLDPVIRHYAEPFDVAAHIENFPDDDLRGREECVYHRLLLEGTSHPEQVLPTVARWRP